MSIYDSSIPQMARTLRQAGVWLDKAQAYAEQKRFDPEVLLSSRLAPDQWSLRQQIQAICLGSQRLGSLLADAETSNPDILDESLPELRVRVDRAVEQLQQLRPEQFQGAEERVIPLPFLPGKGLKATDFVFEFALPNFYFHATTAYAILRHNGVDVGKTDFIGDLSLRDL
ncbi:DUF1993 domain-containing protein [Chondromyces crocatus]|uniref:DUF1993 domain-containing protein n=1 Tax=Chondromyces crocatus TaxID=52 RepID=A0A0K1ESG5_CHOCO|nr:DUF1993 domain-containing protein [Chondromyces crocatus]AKT43811.1 uncharacterized protein CMC5_080480 [Chondromyces crocatus]